MGSGRFKVPAGARSDRFVVALRELNRTVSKLKRQGRRSYYTLQQVRAVWQEFEGRCHYCGILLSPVGTTGDSVRFVHRIPLKKGGKVNRLNLVPVCGAHASDRDDPHAIPHARVVDYNAFGDLIVQLVWATLAHDEKRVAYFKRALDLTLAEFVQELYAIPIGLDEHVVQDPVENESTVSQHVQDITEKLAKLFEEIGYSKRYHPAR